MLLEHVAVRVGLCIGMTVGGAHKVVDSEAVTTSFTDSK